MVQAERPQQPSPYGYVGLDVAESLLVKYYLNAGVYTGTENWAKCLEHAEAVIGRLGKGGFKNSGLCQNYFQNFGANNKDFAIGGANAVNEIIWTHSSRTDHTEPFRPWPDVVCQLHIHV